MTQNRWASDLPHSIRDLGWTPHSLHHISKLHWPLTAFSHMETNCYHTSSIWNTGYLITIWTVFIYFFLAYFFLAHFIEQCCKQIPPTLLCGKTVYLILSTLIQLKLHTHASPRIGSQYCHTDCLNMALPRLNQQWCLVVYLSIVWYAQMSAKSKRNN